MKAVDSYQVEILVFKLYETTLGATWVVESRQAGFDSRYRLRFRIDRYAGSASGTRIGPNVNMLVSDISTLR